MKRLLLLTAPFFWILIASAQLAVTVSPIKVTGQKAIVTLAMTNNFIEKIESARAVVFLLDGQGKMAGQATRWVIGGATNHPPLESKRETTFNFVVTSDKPFDDTNLTAHVIFSRVVLEGGKLADPQNNVVIKQ